MIEILKDTSNWIKEPVSLFYALVVEVKGSSLRKEGATLAVTEDGRISGSVSAGCMEAAVIDVSMRGLQNDRGELISFCERSDDLFEVTSPCDGDVSIVTGPLTPQLIQFAAEKIACQRNILRIVLTQGDSEKIGRQILFSAQTGEKEGSIDAKADDFFILSAIDGLRGKVTIDDSTEIFIDEILPPPQIVIVGGSHIAISLVEIARAVGFYTILIDPRKTFIQPERFPFADRLIHKWPEKAFKEIALTCQTAVAVISHDQKIDDPALKEALKNPVFYIGALGSTGTHQNRTKRLAAAGFTRKELDRIHAPIGLKIGSITPEEIALSIMAEVISVFRKIDQPG